MFLVGLVLGVAAGLVVGILGYPLSMAWLARREYLKASQGAEEGFLPADRASAAADRFRSPEHAN